MPVERELDPHNRQRLLAALEALFAPQPAGAPAQPSPASPAPRDLESQLQKLEPPDEARVRNTLDDPRGQA